MLVTVENCGKLFICTSESKLFNGMGEFYGFDSHVMDACAGVT